MKQFIVDSKVFAVLPQYCLGVVAAKGIRNAGANDGIAAMLDGEAEAFAQAQQGANIPTPLLASISTA